MSITDRKGRARVLTDEQVSAIITGGLLPRGEYDNATDYAVGDAVSYLGSSYVMFNNATAGTLPTDTTYWQIIAEKGEPNTVTDTESINMTLTGGTDIKADLVKQNSTTVDLSVDGSGLKADVADGSISLAKMANMGSSSLIYRKTSGSGVPEVNTIATLKTDLVLVKADVSLGNCDNTSDANKPISDATQTALNAKQATLISATNLKTINSNSLLGAGNLIISGGDVSGPPTNTDSYIPQWNGANSKTLKDGLAVPAGGLAGLTALGGKLDTGLAVLLDQTTPQTILNGQPIQDTLTASQIVATDANKKLSSLAVETYPSLTELSYVKGLSSAIQTQLGGKASLALDNLASVAMNASLQWDNTAARTFDIAPTANTVVGRALTLSAGSTVTGGTADMAGGNLTLNSGLGKGTGASSIIFQTGTTLTTGSTLQTLSTKMTILGNGNVGIGTTSPSTPLHVVIGSGSSASVASFDYIDGVNNRLFEFRSGSSGSAFGFDTNGFLGFGTIAAHGQGGLTSAKMRLYASGGLAFGSTYYATDPGANKAIFEGNVGIGTTSPSNILSLGNTQAQTFWIENSAEDTVGRALTVNAGSTIAGATTNVAGGNLVLNSGLGKGTGASSIIFQTGRTLTTGNTLQTLTTAMTILGSGNVGIGTTTPGDKLQVVSSDGNSGISVTYGSGKASLTTISAEGALRLYNSSGTETIRMAAHSSQVSYINAGNVGIGTTSPATKCDIAGSMQVSSAVALSLGGYVRTYAEATGTPSGTTTYFDIAVNVPTGCKLLGAQLRVDTALTAGETWSAAYITGSTTALAAAGTAVAKNTKVNKMHVDEITSATTLVRITRDAGNFTDAAGVIRAIVYYETMTALGNQA